MKYRFKILLKLIKNLFIEKIVDFFTYSLCLHNLYSFEHTEMMRYQCLRFIQQMCKFRYAHSSQYRTITVFAIANFLRIIVGICQKTEHFDSILLGTNLHNINKSWKIFESSYTITTRFHIFFSKIKQHNHTYIYHKSKRFFEIFEISCKSGFFYYSWGIYPLG